MSNLTHIILNHLWQYISRHTNSQLIYDIVKNVFKYEVIGVIRNPSMGESRVHLTNWFQIVE